MTAHNEILGSVCYIPPETWLGRDPAPSVDLYSFGIILYELATGDVPFDAGSPAELMRLHLDRSAVPPKNINPKTPPWLNKVILKLLEKSPEDRFRSGKELADHVRLHTGTSERKEEASQNTDSFLDSLEEQSKHLTTSIVRNSPAAEGGARKNSVSEPPNRPAVLARQSIAAHPRKARSNSEAIQTTGLQLLRAGLFFTVFGAVFALVRFGFHLAVPPLPWTPGAETSNNVFANLVPGSIYLSLLFSLPTVVLALSCRAWRSALRVGALNVLFFLLAGAGLFALHASGSEYISAASAAQEQLLSVALLLPNAQALPTVLIVQLVFLALAAFNLRLIYRQLGLRKEKLVWGLSGVLGLLLVAETLALGFMPVSEPYSLLVLSTHLSVGALLLGIFHWVVLLAVGIFGSVSKGG